MGKLDGKVALITGGSESIGLASAKHFIIEGIEHVFITGHRQIALEEAVRSLSKERVTAVQVDITNMNDLDKLFSIIQKQTGRLDIVFANAETCLNSALSSITEKHFDDLVNVNVKGVLFTVQKALPLLANGASIILTGSINSAKGLPKTSIYSATKAAVRSFARCWTSDLKERKIRVNVVSPGPIETQMLDDIENNSEENRVSYANMIARSPMNRRGTPNEIAKAVVFLASDDSIYITGIELFVDGGLAQI